MDRLALAGPYAIIMDAIGRHGTEFIAEIRAALAEGWRFGP